MSKFHYDYENHLVKTEDSGNVEAATFDGACADGSGLPPTGRLNTYFAYG